METAADAEKEYRDIIEPVREEGGAEDALMALHIYYCTLQGSSSIHWKMIDKGRHGYWIAWLESLFALPVLWLEFRNADA